MSEPDQPTLRQILEQAKTFAEAEAAIRLLVEGAAPEKQDEHPIDPETGEAVETYGYEAMYNQTIDQYTENLRGRLG